MRISLRRMLGGSIALQLMAGNEAIFLVVPQNGGGLGVDRKVQQVVFNDAGVAGAVNGALLAGAIPVQECLIAGKTGLTGGNELFQLGVFVFFLYFPYSKISFCSNH